MRAIVRPLSNPQVCIDVTECLLGALAAEISHISGGNAVLDRLEAEARLDQLLGTAWRGLSLPVSIQTSQENSNGAHEATNHRADRRVRQPHRQAV